MSRFYLAVYRISQGSAIIAAAALVAMVAFIAYEIVLRYFFSTSTFVQDEFLGYGLSVCIVWSLGYTMENGSMIRVNLLSTRLSYNQQRWLDAIGALATGVLVLGLAWMFWVRAARAYERGTVSATSAEVPIWIPESLILVGLLLFALQLVAHALQRINDHPSPAPGMVLDHQEQ
ncbi:TRAP transporter small permease subunit [Oceanibium sediminis]|uniref:TRAP transporter small permease subunit n=1 Tax=Oceanibium sediminis TaxID=2026339 RepID=UPI000DD38B0D|nr:TRAP transporter small permease [Oceanibium sediminis]